MADAEDTIMFQGSAVCIHVADSTGSYAFVASTRKITRASGSFITDGAEVGQFVIAPGSSANKKKCFRIEAVAALELTLDFAPSDAEAATVTLNLFTPCALITSFTGPEKTNPEIDVSHSLSAAREYKPGLTDNGTFSFEGNCIRDDDGFIALKELQGARGTEDFLLAYSDRLGWERFTASVSAGPTKTGSVDSAITFSASLRVTGAVIDSELLA